MFKKSFFFMVTVFLFTQLSLAQTPPEPIVTNGRILADGGVTKGGRDFGTLHLMEDAAPVLFDKLAIVEKDGTKTLTLIGADGGEFNIVCSRIVCIIGAVSSKPRAK
ncbi:MAG: hypothetical protein AB7F59_13840 [Bdellovibrionales bacterium]